MPTTEKKPFSVSVVIPAFNAQDYIARAIRSVLVQTCPPDEIIVVDDGSTDRTGEVVRQIGEAVRYIRQTNAGAGAARNRGVAEARGDWIGFLDADDEWLPDKLEKQLAVLRKNSQLDWLGGNYYCYSDVTGRRLPRCKVHIVSQWLKEKDYFDDYFVACRANISSWTGVMLIRKDLIDEAGGFDETLHSGEEDTDLWWRIAYIRPCFGYLSAPLAIYYVEVNESLMTRSKPREMISNMIRRHLHMAAQHGREEMFHPIAAKWLSINIRTMLFESRGEDIRCLISEFAPIFSLPYRTGMWLLTAFPALTAKLCFGISRFIRFFNLRRRVVPHPRRNSFPHSSR
jgi:glycosyltransferase involved in cell wall biosynthesis